MRLRLKTSCLPLMWLILMTTWCAGCIPYYGLGQKRVAREPIVFADARTGNAIDTVLVIPRYTSCSGISTAAGEGPGSMRCKVFIAHPFLYHHGQTFAPRQMKGGGLLAILPEAFLGAGSVLDGVVVVAPGYKYLWLWDLWGDRTTMTLIPLAESEPHTQQQDLSTMVDQKTLSGPSKEIFSYAGSDPISVRLTEDERKTIRSFVAKP